MMTRRLFKFFNTSHFKIGLSKRKLLFLECTQVAEKWIHVNEEHVFQSLMGKNLEKSNPRKLLHFQSPLLLFFTTALYNFHKSFTSSSYFLDIYSFYIRITIFHNQNHHNFRKKYVYHPNLSSYSREWKNCIFSLIFP